MRLIGLDIGDVRTGIAISDELGLTARPLETVGTNVLATRLAQLTEENDVTTVVVGRPRHLDGSLGEQAKAVDDVVAGLKEALAAQFVYEDETGTTIAGGGTDADAACVILQGYLSEQE